MSLFLVTGGAGFIGSHLCEKLLDEKHKVICLDNFNDFYNPKIKEKNLNKCLENKDFTLIRGDIRNNSDLDMCFKKGVDFVIHLAAMAGVRPSIENPELYFDVNIMGTQCLLNKMKEYNVFRMIFASSSSIYGNNKKTPFSEDDIVNNQISPYATAKRAGELICNTYHHLYNFEIFCLRFFTVYGPRQRPEMAISLFTNQILNAQTINIFGDGKSQRDYTYITDIIDGISAAIKNIKGYEIINLGGKGTVTLNNLIEKIEKITGKKAIINKTTMQAGDVNITNADISKASKILGYNPNFDINTGILEYYKWLIINH